MFVTVDICVCLPSEKLRDWVSAEDRGAVTISNALDIRLQILVSNDRNLGLESVTGCGTIQLKPFQVLSLGVLAQNLGQDPPLDTVSISGHIFNELQSPCALLITSMMRG